MRVAGQIHDDGLTWQLLQNRARELKHASRKDKQSLASGLRAWHSFATMVLGYLAEESIPPHCSQHVLMYLTLFNNAGTASNYLGCLVSACKYWGLCQDWYDDEVRMVIQGLKNHQAQMQRQLTCNTLLLDEGIMSRLAALCKELPGFAVASELFVLSWSFLLRVQSEGVPLEAGADAELRSLPPHRHAAIVLDELGNLHLRLRCRKNRPGGSLLMRPCTCNGPGGSLLCAPHRAQARLEQMVPGERLFPASESHYLSLFRKALKLLGVPQASNFGFKAFRAGRATQLAKEGKPVHVIMMMGERRNAALLNDVSPDTLDAGVFWQEVHSDTT